ncbi:hypothetical protein PRECH8_01620 [Insulibacter thermoxylanivorax]|uniref:Uncharacterized protein n=1 Tax=Insulibacter thermoxylanivorax TaxID=2749268 RepID=A0A916Q9V1_9BACL|nr:hypothetical protein [Insulibacter thermoxylanivorax]GFR36866.1 hypothetical protein PRECH8_01620 [Insulibacter thermoxylanivorax]
MEAQDRTVRSVSRSEYRTAVIRLLDRTERWLMKLICLLAILLLILQFLLRMEPIRYWLSETDRLEGYAPTRLHNSLNAPPET